MFAPGMEITQANKTAMHLATNLLAGKSSIYHDCLIFQVHDNYASSVSF